MLKKNNTFFNKKNWLSVPLLLLNTVASAANFDSNEPDKDFFSPFAIDGDQGDLLLDPAVFEKSEEDQLKQEINSLLTKIQNNNLQEAKTQVQQLINKKPNVQQLYALKATIDLKLNDRASAKSSLKKVLEIDSANQNAMLNIAAIEYAEGNRKSAEDLLNQAIAKNNKIAAPFLMLAEIANKGNDSKKAEEILINSLGSLKGNAVEEAKVVSGLGRLFLSQKQPNKFLSFAKDLNNRYPDNQPALSVLAAAQMSNDQPKEAEQSLRKLIDLDNSDLRSRLLLANLLSSQEGKEDEVSTILDKISAIDPNNLQLMLQKIDLLIRINRFDDALSISKDISSLPNNKGIGKSIEGDIYRAQREFDKAYAAYFEAYKIKPNDKLLGTLVDILIFQGKQAKAIELLNDELKKNEKNVMAHFRVASLLQQTGKFSEAEQHYNKILALQPKNPIVMNNLAWIYHEQNNPKALELATKAFELAPDSGDIADTLGSFMLKNGQNEKAVEFFEKATKLKPSDPNIKYHLAESYAIQGNKKEAIELLDSITQQNLDFETKEQAKSFLLKLRSE